MLGDVIVKQGDPSDAMYIIEEGVCEVSVCETIRDPCTGERTSDIVERCDIGKRARTPSHLDEACAV